MNLDKKGKTFVISGPSGVGKSTVLKALFEGRDDLYFSVSATTRAPRPGEEHGVNYYFIEPEMFHQWITDGEFLEYAEYVGNFYGTPKSFVREALKEKSVILEIDVVGALNAKKFFPECLLIMIVPPSEEELKKRLKGRRSETEEQIRNRLARIEYELSKKELYDYVVVNDTLENALSRLEEIIDDEKNK